MTTHASILAWKILWTEEPAGIQSRVSERVRHRLSDQAYTQTHISFLLYIQSFVYVNLSLPLYSSPLSLHHVYFLHLWLCFSFVNKFICTIFLDFTYNCYHIVGIFVSLTSLNLTIFVLFNGWVIFHCVYMHIYVRINVCVCVCVYILHFLYPFLCWWMFKLLPCPGYCK